MARNVFNVIIDRVISLVRVKVRSEGDATALLASPPKGRFLIRAEDWQRLKPQADAGWKVLDQGQVGRRRFVLLGS